jgi:hypothetical protein
VARRCECRFPRRNRRSCVLVLSLVALFAMQRQRYVLLHEAPAPLVGNHHRARHAPVHAAGERRPVCDADYGWHQRSRRLGYGANGHGSSASSDASRSEGASA